mmetsp:Transcript_549/g.1421  ORF Transcript_549/g.1421 Transcript_549/m.1421 type:complete len:313 (-) Transcript_549:2-940(-)
MNSGAAVGEAGQGGTGRGERQSVARASVLRELEQAQRRMEGGPAGGLPWIAAAPGAPEPHRADDGDVPDRSAYSGETVSNDHGTAEAAKTRGRPSKFSKADDLRIVRAIVAQNAHVAGFGDKKLAFERAAESLNASGTFPIRVGGKAIQDRYIKLQRKHSVHLKSGSGNGGELDRLLSTMRKAEDDVLRTKRLSRDPARKQTRRKSSGLGSSDDAASTGQRGSEHSDGLTPKRARQDSTDRGFERIASVLRESELARMALERDRMKFEKERLELDIAERQREREERRLENEAQRNLDLEKFKMMMELMMNRK